MLKFDTVLGFKVSIASCLYFAIGYMKPGCKGIGLYITYMG